MLGMYDMPATKDANDRFWKLIQGHLGFGPQYLTRDRDFWDVWLDPELLFAQTCGMPYRTRLHEQVKLVGTPDYALPHCPRGHYYSVLVARTKDGREMRELVSGTFAYNEGLSQSGWAAPITYLLDQNLKPEKLLETGAHALSAQAVVEGRADFASLDALTWALLTEHSNLGQTLREVAITPPTPALPYITAIGQDAACVATAVSAAINDLAASDRRLLHLKRLTQVTPAEYLAVPNPPKPKTLMARN
ncbi:phosphate/phosphite/phosphonate ABC transporter substrate-binding protein [Ruegeria arenilitoris]|uniref:phosphate/phosphite/phosphonate ABC transporter substrate-binding protein n=1 Tax=Ruegeria arenilitoris TaxID=1173585 RepID=UPI001580AE50|nr:PhnD/SsuA/transferrin family substrate-binding protein [Ruegeria arenilitoris]